MKPTYSELLRRPEWQKRRLQRLEAAKWMCQCCHDASTTLHVHHRRYVKGRNPWEYDDVDLVVLCEACHEDEHASLSEIQALVPLLLSMAHPPLSARDIAELLAGVASTVVPEIERHQEKDDWIEAFAFESRARLAGEVAGLMLGSAPFDMPNCRSRHDDLMLVIGRHELASLYPAKADAAQPPA